MPSVQGRKQATQDACELQKSQQLSLESKLRRILRRHKKLKHSHGCVTSDGRCCRFFQRILWPFLGAATILGGAVAAMTCYDWITYNHNCKHLVFITPSAPKKSTFSATSSRRRLFKSRRVREVNGIRAEGIAGHGISIDGHSRYHSCQSMDFDR